jgi:hypothetical protein
MLLDLAYLIKYLSSFNIESVLLRTIKRGVIKHCLMEDLIQGILVPGISGTVENLCLMPYDVLSRLSEITKIIGG